MPDWTANWRSAGYIHIRFVDGAGSLTSILDFFFFNEYIAL